MITLLRKSIYALFALFLLTAFSGCSKDDFYLHYALKAAGENKSELKAVLKHYRTVDKDPQKLKAAKYLIANMPGHYSYADTIMANRFYDVALKILKSGKDAEWQRDTIRQISERDFPGMMENTVSDLKVMTADYLIYSIDHAFTQWRTRPWAQHLTYEEFRDWLLPYKVSELQKFDHWRDTLSAHFSDSISRLPIDNDQCWTIYGALDIVRNEMVGKLKPYLAWTTESGHPLLSAETMANTTYGSCLDYVTLGTAVFRSVGLPAAVDNVPLWGRNHEGHSWFTQLTDQGKQVPTSNDITMPAGWGFFPYQRFPKIFRVSYAINPKLLKYYRTAKYIHPFDLFKHDITDYYYRTSDICIENTKEIKLKDKYVYIATLANVNGPEWVILDLGTIRKGKAYFQNIGREIMYTVLGFNGEQLVPISDPFIVKKDGSLEYIEYDDSDARSVTVKRKYYESYNVVVQRRKILGARIQCANKSDFSDSITVYTINSTDIPDKIKLNNKGAYRYWRYLAADGTNGSIAELAFFNSEEEKIEGNPVACKSATSDAIANAFDENWLSNFETEEPDGNWIGYDMKDKVNVEYVRVVPRSDDNDVCPGNEYELLCYDSDNDYWYSLGYRKATDNRLEYSNVPIKGLLWLKNYTRGWAERPFVINGNEVTYW